VGAVGPECRRAERAGARTNRCASARAASLRLPLHRPDRPCRQAQHRWPAAGPPCIRATHGSWPGAGAPADDDEQGGSPPPHGAGRHPRSLVGANQARPARSRAWSFIAAAVPGSSMKIWAGFCVPLGRSAMAETGRVGPAVDGELLVRHAFANREGLARMQKGRNRSRCKISTLAAIAGRGRKGDPRSLLRTPLCWWIRHKPQCGGPAKYGQIQSLSLPPRLLDLTDSNAISPSSLTAWAMPRTCL